MDKIKELKNTVKKLSSKKSFIHNKWYYKNHLLVVEKFCKELCLIYKDVNKSDVEALVWLHDLGKIMSAEDPDSATLTEGRKLLKTIGYDKSDIERIINYCNLIDSLDSFENAPLEVKILSSADGGSHFFGPFFELFMYENPKEKLALLYEKQIKKALKDFNKKIVLPEVRYFVLPRFKLILEQNDPKLSEIKLSDLFCNTGLASDIINEETFVREVHLCRKLSEKKNGRCCWGECDKCGVFPLLYKLKYGVILEDADSIKKAKDLV